MDRFKCQDFLLIARAGFELIARSSTSSSATSLSSLVSGAERMPRPIVITFAYASRGDEMAEVVEQMNGHKRRHKRRRCPARGFRPSPAKWISS
jgi:hypothetical protein